MPRTLVLFVFHQYNDRVEHFLRNAIFYDENIDFIVISNSRDNVFEVPPYVKTLFRDNIGFDFGGWSDGLLTDDLYKQYDNFIFINSSVIGPFIDSGKWTDAYLSKLNVNNVKLIGSTINTMSLAHILAHVQTYAFAVDREALEYLIAEELFTTKKYTKTIEDTVFFKEIGMSRLIVAKGWNISSLHRLYKSVDFTNTYRYKFPPLRDIMSKEYCNILWSPYELVFLKGNRVNIPAPTVQN
jgi:lipopolysaccharide biosynthesis protein